MRVVFVSNFFNHHQAALSSALDRLTEEQYVFIETAPMDAERTAMGWGERDIPDYVLQWYRGEAEASRCQQLINEADVVIYGSASLELLEARFRAGKLTLRYSERMFKERNCPWYELLPRKVLNWKRHGRWKNHYLLCASAYAAEDYAKVGVFRGKAYRWGYFPAVQTYDLDALFARKHENPRVRLLWVARMIDWKHPELAVQTAIYLREQGVSFNLEMIGAGSELETVRSLIEEAELADYVHLLGTMSPEDVRRHMEQADIFLFTSDRNEGWGAVLNESMNSGCAVVADRAIGSAPYLLREGENGLLYSGNGELFEKTLALARNAALRVRLGCAAYMTIAEEWNADMAAERLLLLVEELEEKGRCGRFVKGPCSRAD